MKQEIKRKNSSINTITVEKLSIKKNRIKFSPNKNGFERLIYNLYESFVIIRHCVRKQTLY
jgi:hypothetical protein